MPTILFIELLGGIGDLIMALPAIQAIARSHPQAHLTVFTFAPGCELLTADPLIDAVITCDRAHPRRFLAHFLDHHSFDLIVSDTCYDGIDQLVQATGAAQTVTNLWRSPPPDQPVGERFLDILLAEGVIVPQAIAPAQLHLTPTEVEQAQVHFSSINRPLVFLYPEAGMAIKHWPPAHFVRLGRALQARTQATLVIPVGSDPDLAAGIATQIGGQARIWPRGSLRQLAAAIAMADLFIAADTGPARIAAALAVTTITLFGPTWQGRYGQPTPHVNVQAYPDCEERAIANFTLQRCWREGVCPLDRWQTCMEEIQPAAVLAVAEPILKQISWDQGAIGGDRPNPPTPFPEGKGGPEWDSKGVASVGSDSPPRVGEGLGEGFDQTARSPTASNSQTHGTTPDPAWSRVQNLLVMRLDNIGDVIMTSPALRALREHLPQAQITLMASPGGALAAPLLPWIDQIWPWRSLWQDLGRLDFDPAREWDLIASLRQRQFDAVIICTSFSQSPHPAALVCALAEIPLRLGATKETGSGVLTTEVTPLPDASHQVDRNLHLLETVGFRVRDRSLAIQIPPEAVASAIARLHQQGLPPDPPYLLLNPWTSCQSRTYAWERFAIAARELAQITTWPVVVTGMAQDRDRSAPLLAALGKSGIDLVGQTNFAELAALVDRAQLLLSNNTSTMHLADACRTPSVILFAGTEYESQWQPRHTPARLLRRPTPCSPCYSFTCPYDLECLDLAPEQVVAAGRSLLGRSDSCQVKS